MQCGIAIPTATDSCGMPRTTTHPGEDRPGKRYRRGSGAQCRRRTRPSALLSRLRRQRLFDSVQHLFDILNRRLRRDIAMHDPVPQRNEVTQATPTGPVKR